MHWTVHIINSKSNHNCQFKSDGHDLLQRPAVTAGNPFPKNNDMLCVWSYKHVDQALDPLNFVLFLPSSPHRPFYIFFYIIYIMLSISVKTINTCNLVSWSRGRDYSSAYLEVLFCLNSTSATLIMPVGTSASYHSWIISKSGNPTAIT
jgi:hypothetical protein